MRLTIIPSDKFISIDNEGLLNVSQDLSWIPENIHAVQWYDTWGEVEYTNNDPNLIINELGIYLQAVVDHANEKNKILNDKYQEELSRDYLSELRINRNRFLSFTDWTQLPDTNLSETKKQEWINYRQTLRDLPANIQDPKPYATDPSLWPQPPEYIGFLEF